MSEADQQFWLRGLVASVDGTQIISGECRGAWAEVETLGVALAESLLAQGADALICQINAG
jgi:hydroxymethylbilane synthase